ncbi:MAG: hypothetical protein IPM48_12155 [Saprospiraceae bacterium]|nr:hypothetical protein [Saprospiraceae bacterium]
MIKFVEFIRRISNWKSFLFFFACYMVFNLFILKNAETRMNGLAGKEVGVIDLTFGYSPQRALDMVAAYGDEGRAFYARTEYTADLVYPLVYAFLFSIVFVLLYRNSAQPWMILLPFLTLLLDYSENVFIVSLLTNYPLQSMQSAIFCEIFKLLKWVCFVFIIGLVLFGLLRKAFSSFNRNKA